MKISTKTRYGLRALVYLTKAKYYCSVKKIATVEEIPYDYLEKILTKLKQANIVKTKLGKQGGFTLAKPAMSITAGEVMRILEGTLAPVMCVAYEKDKKIHCHRSRNCITKKIWVAVQDNLIKTLNSITLASLTK